MDRGNRSCFVGNRAVETFDWTRGEDKGDASSLRRSSLLAKSDLFDLKGLRV